MVVKGPKGVGDVESMMSDVKGEVEPAVHVHGAVEEVLPRVDYEGGEGVAGEGDESPVEELGGEEDGLGGSGGWAGREVSTEVFGELRAIDADD